MMFRWITRLTGRKKAQRGPTDMTLIRTLVAQAEARGHDMTMMRGLLATHAAEQTPPSPDERDEEIRRLRIALAALQAERLGLTEEDED